MYYLVCKVILGFTTHKNQNSLMELKHISCNQWEKNLMHTFGEYHTKTATVTAYQSVPWTLEPNNLFAAGVLHLIL